MYNFKDTKEHGPSMGPLLSEALSIDGEYIENHIAGYRTLAVSGRESLEYNVTDEDRPVGIDGMEYYGKRQPDRTITVKFSLQASTASAFMAQYRQLKNFCKGDNRKLRFADEPNAHYVGTLVTVDEPDSGQISVVGEMAFYCPDPHLISDMLNSDTAVTENGILTAHVNNDGSAEVYPVYRIKHATENGYLGIVQKGGALEIGNRDEADVEPYTRSEVLTAGITDFKPYAGVNAKNPAILTNGTLELGSDGYLRLKTAGSGTHWHGGSCQWNLPADSNGEVGAKNFYLWFRLHFMTGLMGQTGLIQVMLVDAGGNLIAGFEVHKEDTTGNKAYVQGWVGGNTRKEVFRIDFVPSIYEKDNHFIYSKGYEDLLKEGGRIRFFYFGRYYEANVPELANTKVMGVQVFIGQYGTRNITSSQYVTVCRLSELRGRKDYVNKIKDIPNRYGADSEIVVDTESDSITVNGLPANNELVDGSEFAMLPIGETDIEFYPSPWCQTKPTVTVEYRKRWI
ncbi:distal tail protein Dit [Faecalicatena contorta]|uniref:Putative phage tail component, N-terminal domain-containing protein n=1 Tax=Faecalicatena contorta TaxID=39482 RepID=A0A315ZUZ7_9FIRM|nr:distal tail protein Dit [Faecalicatena contorta]PWJ49142.1 putative phage tail component-like protein [Faecalicatena contorta]SUQ14847.1 putative phage tail component, N-terminal domain-containing protein [Faecalicatena contorta]